MSKIDRGDLVQVVILILAALYALYSQFYFFTGLLATLAFLALPGTKKATPLHKKLERPARFFDKLSDYGKAMASIIFLIPGFLLFAVIGRNIISFPPSASVFDLIVGIVTALLIVPCAFFLKLGYVLLKGESVYYSMKKLE